MLLCTLDITSVYTNIPHNECVPSIKEMLAIHKPPNSLTQNSYIIELLEVVLTNNHIDFNGKHYHQVSGTAMGTKLAPWYANLFMTKFEVKYVYTLNLNLIFSESKYFEQEKFEHWLGLEPRSLGVWLSAFTFRPPALSLLIAL